MSPPPDPYQSYRLVVGRVGAVDRAAPPPSASATATTTVSLCTGDEGFSSTSDTGATLDSVATTTASSFEDLSSLQNSSRPSSSSSDGSSDLGDVAEGIRDLGPRSSSLSDCSGSVFGGVFLWLPFELSHSRRSYAIFDAMFLKPMLVPEMRLNRTPLRDSRGNLQTSISHCTRESVFGSPWTHRRTNLKGGEVIG